MTDSARVGIARTGLARVGSLGVISDSGMGADTAGAMAAFTIRDFGGRTPSIPFTRNSPAYLPDGTEVGPNVPRLVTVDGRTGLLVEEGTTNVWDNRNNKTRTWRRNEGSWITFVSDNEILVDFSVEGSSDSLLYYPSLSGVAEGPYTFSAEYEVYEYHTTASASNGFQLYIHDASGNTLGRSEILQPKPGERGRLHVTVNNPAGNTSFSRLGVSWGNNMAVGDRVRMRVFNFQIEAKPYPTSWTIDTRAPESLTIPAAGVVDPQKGTVEAWVYVNDIVRRQVTSHWPTVVLIRKGTSTANWIWFHHHYNGNWVLQVRREDGTITRQGTFPDSYTPDGWHYFMVRWDAQAGTAAVLHNGIKRIELTGVEFPAEYDRVEIGHRHGSGREFLNSLIGPVRVSSRVRSDEEAAAAYEAWQQGRGLERDADTTYLLGFDETRIQVEAELTAKDGGVGGEALPPLSASLSVGDQGLGADALLPLSAALSVGDQGLGADAPAGGWATTFLFDDGTASEHVIREILAVAIFVEDSGTGADAVRKDFILIAVYDPGIGTDSIAQITASVKATDSGTGQDGQRQHGTATVPDAAQGEDDLASIVARVETTDGGFGDEQLAITSRLSVADSGAGGEAVASARIINVADHGGLADHAAYVGLARVGYARVGHLGGGETINIRTSATASDYGQGFDDVYSASIVTVLDEGFGGDQLAIQAVLTLLDQGFGETTHIDITELTRPPFRAIVVDPRTVPQLKNPKTKAVLWP